MSSAPKLTRENYHVIREHNERLAEGFHSLIITVRAIPAAQRPKYLQGQLWYALNVVSALEWSTKVAAQQAGVNDNATTAI